ncbi:MAG TPA: hypothetical protein VEB43_10580 [Anaeromyxobacter sp.]|nr:hypothetical protein [Anaeromyxobacter sp.]
MAKLFSAAVALTLFLAPLSARAGGLFEASLGSGLRWDPEPTERIPTNVMLAAGYSFPVVKLELGALANLGDVEDSEFDVDLRPMIVVKPPLFPLYVRGILSYGNLIEGPKSFGYGGALGVRIGALGVGGFVEAGALTKKVKVGDVEEDIWFAEGRLGVYWD